MGGFLSDSGSTQSKRSETEKLDHPIDCKLPLIHIEADAPFTMEWETSSQSGTGSSSSVSVSQVPSGEKDTAHIWQGEIETNQLEQLALRTSTNARTIIHWGDAVVLDGAGP